MKPLESCRVLELAFYLPAPLAGLILSDLGADVIKVEAPPAGDIFRMLGGNFSTEGGKGFHSFNRGKRSCMLDLKTQEGMEAFMHLVGKSDVLLVSLRPSTIEKLGIDYKSVEKVNPKIIYCSLSGYGMNGPWAERAGHDMNYQTLAGILHLARDDDGNVVFPPVPMADIFGSFNSVVGILAALLEREKTGKGRLLDLSMVESVLSANLFNLSISDIPGETYAARGKMLTGRYAFYNVYESRDGKWFGLGAIEDKFWKRFCEAVAREDLISRQFDVTVIPVVREIFKEKDSEYWNKISKEEDICMEPIYDLEGVFTHPQHLARNAFAYNTDKVLAYGFFPYDPDEKKLKAPLPGEHTEEVLKECSVPSNLIKAITQK